MKYKRGGTASPIIDFWSIVIYFLLIIVIMGVFFLMGGCEKSFSTLEIRSAESEVSAKQILLTFLKSPTKENLNTPSNENMADLIVRAQGNPERIDQLDTEIKSYFSINYYDFWKLNIIYPSGIPLEFEPDDMDYDPIKNYVKQVIGSSTSSTFSKFKDEINYERLDDFKVSLRIPSINNQPIIIELMLDSYPTYPIFNNFIGNRRLLSN